MAELFLSFIHSFIYIYLQINFFFLKKEKQFLSPVAWFVGVTDTHREGKRRREERGERREERSQIFNFGGVA